VTKNKKYVIDKNGHKVLRSSSNAVGKGTERPEGKPSKTTVKFVQLGIVRSKAVSKRNRKPKGKKVKYTVKFAELSIVSDSVSTNSVSTKK
jgi:hypothetical protein